MIERYVTNGREESKSWRVLKRIRRTAPLVARAIAQKYKPEQRLKVRLLITIIPKMHNHAIPIRPLL